MKRDHQSDDDGDGSASRHQVDTIDSVSNGRNGIEDRNLINAAAAGTEAGRATLSDSERQQNTITNHDLGSLDSNANLPEYVKEHNNTLTFPEKLMLMLVHVERECAKQGKREGDASVGWVLGGTAFVIRNQEKLCASWLPLFFGQAKFSSFTRKLYRWGFRKINMSPHPEGEQPSAGRFFFGNENFQRDNKNLLAQMKSITAAKTRTEMATEVNRNSLMQTNATGQNPVPAVNLNPQAINGGGPANPLAVLTQPLGFPFPFPTLPLGQGAPNGANNQSGLIQQAVNLATLQNLLSTQPLNLQALQGLNAQTAAVNPFLSSIYQASGIPIGNSLPQGASAPVPPPSPAIPQALQQFSAAAAMAALGTNAVGTAGALQPGSAFQFPALLSSTSLPILPHIQNATQEIPNPADQDRLQGVIDMLLRYGQTQGQAATLPSQPVGQQAAEQPPPQPPKDPPPPT